MTSPGTSGLAGRACLHSSQVCHHGCDDGGIGSGPKGGPIAPPKPPATREELLQQFDRLAAEVPRANAGAGHEHLSQPWSLLMNEKVLFTMPRFTVVRNFMLNHLIHHRVHLCVYLRLNDIPVPGLYGPSADEAFM